MDVTLVLTHRCNLACHYCYSGEHFRKEMDDLTMERGLDLLFADGSDVAQLGFFGGEPFLAFDAMRRAIEGARRRADAGNRRLLLQCTTNGTVMNAAQVELVARTGMRITVSLDGVREAHEINRPTAGGGSSFDDVQRGLRALIDAGTHPDVLMVITPATAPFVFRSVSWLWEQGIDKVRANLAVDTAWSELEKTELREELLAVWFDLLARRLRGQPVVFEPFGTVDVPPSADAALTVRCGAPKSRRRPQAVVATSGNLYPCAPMVGEDRDEGREAAMRIGHLDDGHDAILARVTRDGEGCGDGRRCACAAWLETGDPTTTGPNGQWFGRLSAEIGKGIAQALAEARRAKDAAAVIAPPPDRPERPERRPWIWGLAIGAGAAVLGGSALLSAFLSPTTCARPVVLPRPGDRDRTATAGEMAPIQNVPPPVPPPPPTPPVNQVDLHPIPQPPQPPQHETPMPGEMMVAPEPVPPPPPTAVQGDMAVPAPEPPPDQGQVRGRMRIVR